MTSQSEPRENDRRFRWLLGSLLGSGLVLTMGVAVVRGSQAGASAAFGAGVAALNLVALRYLIRALTAAAAGTGKSGGLVSFLLSMKLVILLALVWLLLSRHVVSAGPLAIGYCALPIGVAIGTLLCDKASGSNA